MTRSQDVSRIGYEVQYTSSSDGDGLRKELFRSLGWKSSKWAHCDVILDWDLDRLDFNFRYCHYPQEIVLKLHFQSRISEILVARNGDLIRKIFDLKIIFSIISNFSIQASDIDVFIGSNRDDRPSLSKANFSLIG